MAGAPEHAVEAWLRQHATLTRAQFEARFAHPFLLRRREVRREGDEDFGEKVAFDTGVIPPVAPGVSQGFLGRLEDALVLPVVKAPQNPFPDRISVGRALNCDVVVREPSVSKLHAHFRVISPDLAFLTDVGSQNGTRLNGRRIEPNRAVQVVSGDSLLFGAVSLKFLAAGELYDLLGAAELD